MNRNFTRFAFTESVKEAQERYGTRHSGLGLELPATHHAALHDR